ncbi:MAG TPA: metallophosphoesterase, partial [Saprospiraceae bacterium]|nr:metallophosphoesterase [Saprospiraceae bacterium]
SQSGWSTFQDIINQMIKHDDDFSIGLGDFVNDGFNTEEWAKFCNTIEPLVNKNPLFTLPGNHDYDGYYDQLFPKNYYLHTRTPIEKPTYYSFIKNDCYFIALDPNKNFPLAIDPEQKKWLAKEVNKKQFKNALWKFLLIHQPPYAQGWSGYEGDYFIRALLDEFALRQTIDFVLSGHNHNYERKLDHNDEHQICYIISGGAGGGLESEPQSYTFPMDKIVKKHHYCRMQVDKTNAILTVYGLDGSVLDHLKISKK